MKKLFHPCESGRSMIEMLGVLAIIGILSIGVLATYSVLMQRHRNNELLQEVTMRAMAVSTQFLTDTEPNLEGFEEEAIGIKVALTASPSIKNCEGGFSKCSPTPEDEEFALELAGISSQPCQYFVTLAQGDTSIIQRVVNAQGDEISTAECPADESATATIYLVYNSDLAITKAEEVQEILGTDEGNLCGDHASPYTYEGVSGCKCDPKYSGRPCLANEHACSGHGFWFYSGSVSKCVCDDGFEGTYCDQAGPCLEIEKKNGKEILVNLSAGKACKLGQTTQGTCDGKGTCVPNISLSPAQQTTSNNMKTVSDLLKADFESVDCHGLPDCADVVATLKKIKAVSQDMNNLSATISDPENAEYERAVKAFHNRYGTSEELWEHLEKLLPKKTSFLFQEFLGNIGIKTAWAMEEFTANPKVVQQALEFLGIFGGGDECPDGGVKKSGYCCKNGEVYTGRGYRPVPISFGDNKHPCEGSCSKDHAECPGVNNGCCNKGETCQHKDKGHICACPNDAVFCGGQCVKGGCCLDDDGKGNPTIPCKGENQKCQHHQCVCAFKQAGEKCCAEKEIPCGENCCGEDQKCNKAEGKCECKWAQAEDGTCCQKGQKVIDGVCADGGCPQGLRDCGDGICQDVACCTDSDCSFLGLGSKKCIEGSCQCPKDKGLIECDGKCVKGECCPLDDDPSCPTNETCVLYKCTCLNTKTTEGRCCPENLDACGTDCGCEDLRHCVDGSCECQYGKDRNDDCCKEHQHLSEDGYCIDDCDKGQVDCGNGCIPGVCCPDRPDDCPENAECVKNTCACMSGWTDDGKCCGKGQKPCGNTCVPENEECCGEDGAPCNNGGYCMNHRCFCERGQDKKTGKCCTNVQKLCGDDCIAEDAECCNISGCFGGQKCDSDNSHKCKCLTDGQEPCGAACCDKGKCKDASKSQCEGGNSCASMGGTTGDNGACCKGNYRLNPANNQFDIPDSENCYQCEIEDVSYASTSSKSYESTSSKSTKKKCCPKGQFDCGGKCIPNCVGPTKCIEERHACLCPDWGEPIAGFLGILKCCKEDEERCGNTCCSPNKRCQTNPDGSTQCVDGCPSDKPKLCGERTLSPGKCVKECCLSSECESGNLCVFGECQCDEGLHTCPGSTKCVECCNNKECGEGAMCQDDKCVPKCTPPATLGKDGETCCENGKPMDGQKHSTSEEITICGCPGGKVPLSEEIRNYGGFGLNYFVTKCCNKNEQLCGGECITKCKGDTSCVPTEHKCKCPDNRQPTDNGKCCPVGQDACKNQCCAPDRHCEGDKCVCWSDQETTDGKCCPRDREVCGTACCDKGLHCLDANKGSCGTCSGSTPHWDGSKCVECTDDTHCAGQGGKTCQGGICLCPTNTEYAEVDKVCCEGKSCDGVCVPGAKCCDKSNCEKGQLCFENQCIPACQEYKNYYTQRPPYGYMISGLCDGKDGRPLRCREQENDYDLGCW